MRWYQTVYRLMYRRHAADRFELWRYELHRNST